MEDHTISHIDQSFDSLSQLVTRQKSFMSSTSTQNEFEIAEEPTISEPNLKPNDYPLSIAKQLVIADKLLSDSYPSTHVDAAFNGFFFTKMSQGLGIIRIIT